jgi:hypothetical protein
MKTQAAAAALRASLLPDFRILYEKFVNVDYSEHLRPTFATQSFLNYKFKQMNFDTAVYKQKNIIIYNNIYL